MWWRRVAGAVAAAVLSVGMASAEVVQVKYQGAVDLVHFNCDTITRSSFIQRVCYDEQNRYMLISLNGTYYGYCGIPITEVASLRAAPSMGQYFNAHIKGRYDCRVTPPPTYR